VRFSDEGQQPANDRKVRIAMIAKITLVVIWFFSLMGFLLREKM